MSNPAIKLYVVTNHADHAAIDVFARDPACLPGWARIVTDAMQFSSIPTGAKVITRFYGPRGLFEDLWVEERVARAFDLDLFAHMDAVDAWRKRVWADAERVPAVADVPGPEAAQQSRTSETPRSRRIWS